MGRAVSRFGLRSIRVAPSIAAARPGRCSLGLPTVAALFPHSEAMIAKMGLCVLDEGAVSRYVLAELLASNVRGAMRKDIGPSPESLAG